MRPFASRGTIIHSDISVITLHKDRPRHLRRLIEGLTRDGFTGDLVIAEMGSVTPLPSLPFAVTQLDVRGGVLPLAKARNAGRAAATGSRLVFLDVDCISANGMVSVLADVLEQHDAFVCAQVRYLREDVRNGWTEADLVASSEMHPDRVFPTSGVQAVAHPGLFWSLAFAVRANTFDRLRGFDETFTGYGGEDTDLAFRAHDAGIPLLLCADATAFHQPHDSFEPPLQHFTDVMRNASLFRERHGAWPMQGWLDGFQTLGLIERAAAGGYRIVRAPTAQEIAAARVR